MVNPLTRINAPQRTDEPIVGAAPPMGREARWRPKGDGRGATASILRRRSRSTGRGGAKKWHRSIGFPGEIRHSPAERLRFVLRILKIFAPPRSRRGARENAPFWYGRRGGAARKKNLHGGSGAGADTAQRLRLVGGAFAKKSSEFFRAWRRTMRHAAPAQGSPRRRRKRKAVHAPARCRRFPGGEGRRRGGA